jgi:hypothetical protein
MTKAPKVTDSTHDAELAFGSLMAGVPVRLKSGMSHVEQIETVLRLMSGIIQRITETDNMGTPAELRGLSTAAGYVQEHMKRLAQDDREKARVRKYETALSNMGNLVKAFQQRQEEAARKNGNGFDPELQAKLAGDAAINRQKLEAKDAEEKQKLLHRQTAFTADQRNKSIAAKADVDRGDAKTAQELKTNAMLGVVEAAKAADEKDDSDDSKD